VIDRGLLVDTGVAVVALAGITVTVLQVFRVPFPFAPPRAILRGALQLAAVSLVLGGVIHHGWLVAAALGVMFVVAAVTASRRLGSETRYLAIVVVAMLVGIGVTLAVVFALGAIEFSPRFALAIGGIVIGNAMSIASLSGRQFLAAAHRQWEEVEGWLALGATPRQATLHLARAAVHSALIPSVDQTRTTGLVTLPGAFVGAIFGGVSPLEAGRFQLVVLASIMAAGTLTAVVVVWALAPVKVRPGATA
jgi:putative ABC transport system permease protein